MRGRWLIVAGVLLSLLSAGKATDVGELEPVAAVQLIGTPNGIEIRTDTGAWGAGATLSDAVADLQRRADARVFLDTADDLLLSDYPPDGLSELFACFRPACRVCVAPRNIAISEVPAYLSAHPPTATVNDLRVSL